ncbi:helix-turn-helix transcriptional regulator [Leptospira sp. 201903075]|uniref:helix-turn-helix domain-containing protein n=1 Tax=Leptospira chreensis TaxID=2810035 RepID=UPI001965FB3D|nr:helix-turn-helix transcriptional regulator [Leptospira chreensis]MBM9590561.1 helix-turn-helix transcriptional regulator [Leptospira chreensis]
MTNSFGKLLRMLRKAKKKSQLDLALEAGISSKHLSFLESGRSIPGRDVVRKLTNALDIQSLYRSLLFLKAGFSMDFPLVNQEESESLLTILTSQMDEYFASPTFVVSSNGKINLSNPALNFLLSALQGKESKAESLSVDELLLGEEGFGPYILNFDNLAERLITRRSLENYLGSEEAKPHFLKLNGLDKSEHGNFTIQLEYNGLLTFEIIQAVIGHPLEVNTRSVRIFYMIPSDPISKDIMRSLVSNDLNQFSIL